MKSVSLAERSTLQADAPAATTVAPNGDAHAATMPPARPLLRDRILRPLFWLPVVVFTSMAIFTSVKTIIHRLTLDIPQHPWEAAIVVDAERVARGLPVYLELGGAHATHLYGPLTNYFLGAIYKLTGPEFWVGRAVNVAAAGVILVVIWLGAIDRRRPIQWLLALGFFIALHYKCRAYFTETRPDLIGAMLATLAFVAAYFAYVKDRVWLYAVSAVLAVLAFMFKQPYAAVAAVPVLAVLLGRPQRFWRHLIFASLPGVALVATLLVMRLKFPIAYFYTVKAPSTFPINWNRIVFAFMALWLYTPVYALCLAGEALLRPANLRRDAKRLWLHCASAIGAGAGVLAFAKHGGTYNSLLLGWLPMTAYILFTLPALIDGMYAKLTDDAPADGAGAPRTSVWDFTRLAYLALFSIFLGAIVYTNHYGVPLAGRWAFDGGHGATQGRADMIRVVQRLSKNGKVLVPDDPTLTLHALGTLERSYDAEFDAANRRSPLAPYMVKWLRSAKYIVRVESVFNNLSDEALTSMGFHPMTVNRRETLGADGATLWQYRGKSRRRRHATTTTAPTTQVSAPAAETPKPTPPAIPKPKPKRPELP